MPPLLQDDAENDFGEVAFYPQATLLLAITIVVFLGTCVVGTIFRRVVPMETPFYQPRMRPDQDASKFARQCWEPTGFYFSQLGP